MHRQIYGFVKFITYLFSTAYLREQMYSNTLVRYVIFLSISFIESSGLFPVKWTIRDNRRQSQPQPFREGVES